MSGKRPPSLHSDWFGLSYVDETCRKRWTASTEYANTVEGSHRQLRKVTKTKTAYPSDDALRKIIYLATVDITRNWSVPVREWADYMSQFVIQSVTG